MGKALSHQRCARFHEFGGRQGQAQGFDDIGRQVVGAQANGVLLDAPVEDLAVPLGNHLRDFGVDALGVQKQAIHIEDDGLDGAHARYCSVHRACSVVVEKAPEYGCGRGLSKSQRRRLH
ncbi:hypothetical protein AO269_23640 [Pseudomonas putida]|nr:hypothetical protein AO269_23640 [Pseudomonas putida]